MISAGVHFGHGASRWNPKMAPYIFAKRGKIHIIDVKQTIRGVLIAKKLLAEVASQGKDLVFVGTKRQARNVVKNAAERCGMSYVCERWLGGTLTNFRTIRSRLQRLEELEQMEESGTLDSESKKLAARLRREMRKIRSNLGGLRDLNKLPGAVVVVDGNKEYIALAEARKLGIPTIGILDTDCDPDTVDIAIPANDDSIHAVEIILEELADAVAVGKTLAGRPQAAAAATRRPRGRSSRRALGRAQEDTKQPSATTAVKEPGESAAPEQATETKKENTEQEPAETEGAQQSQ